MTLRWLLALGLAANAVLAQNPLFAPASTLFPGPIRNDDFVSEKYTGVSLLSPSQSKSHPRWMDHLTIESFGYDSKPVAPGFQFSPGYTASMFNLEGLECPRCVLGPRNPTRFTLPPFGANATLKLRDGRVELFTGFGAIEAWKADGTLEPRGLRSFSNADGDAWLTQMQAGGRVSLDRNQHVWVGASSRYLYNFGPGMRQWNTLSGEATFRLGH
jgi:hypothetical protein